MPFFPHTNALGSTDYKSAGYPFATIQRDFSYAYISFQFYRQLIYDWKMGEKKS